MDEKRLECIMLGLNRYELTGLEKRFVQSVEQYFKEKNVDGTTGKVFIGKKQD